MLRLRQGNIAYTLLALRPIVLFWFTIIWCFSRVIFISFYSSVLIHFRLELQVFHDLNYFEIILPLKLLKSFLLIILYGQRFLEVVELLSILSSHQKSDVLDPQDIFEIMFFLFSIFVILSSFNNAR